MENQENWISGFIYARYSSHNQRDVSIEQQVEACQKFAAANRIKIVATYADRAISGKTDSRPQFQKMMRDAQKGKATVVIAWKSNRIGRNMLQAMVNEARLTEYGVRCLYVEEDFDDTAAGRFALRNMMNVNQFYIENMAEDVMRGMMDNAKRCMVNGGVLPLGYKKGSDGKYEIDEPNAAVVREIFERVSSGEPFASIAEDFNLRGLKTSKGSFWNKNSFRAMLKNVRYIGVYEFAGMQIEGGIPAIIDKEVFYSVQDRMRNKKNPQGRHRDVNDYLLTGKLFCGHCGAYMVGVSGTSRSGAMHYYYKCQTRHKDKSCSKKNVKKDWIEQHVAELVAQNILSDNVIEWIADGYHAMIQSHRKDSALLAAQEELAEVKKSLKNVMVAIEQGIITSSTKDRLLELESEKRRLETVVAVEQAAQTELSRDEIIFWLESFRKGDAKDKAFQKNLIDAFVQAVYLFDDKITIVFNYCNNREKLDFSIADLAESEPSIDDSGLADCSHKLPFGVP